MKISGRVQPDNLEHSELQFSVFIAVTVMVLAVGMAVLMYPVVFSHQTPGDRTMHTAFWGFCVLCVLLTVYVWDRHATIRQLRREMVEGRRQIAETRREASVELLKTMPNMSSFQDRLPMEFRRMATTTEKLSIVVVNIKFPAGSFQSIGNRFGDGRCRQSHLSKDARTGFHLHFGSGLFWRSLAGSGPEQRRARVCPPEGRIG